MDEISGDEVATVIKNGLVCTKQITAREVLPATDEYDYLLKKVLVPGLLKH